MVTLKGLTDPAARELRRHPAPFTASLALCRCFLVWRPAGTLGPVISDRLISVSGHSAPAASGGRACILLHKRSGISPHTDLQIPALANPLSSLVPLPRTSLIHAVCLISVARLWATRSPSHLVAVRFEPGTPTAIGAEKGYCYSHFFSFFFL